MIMGLMISKSLWTSAIFIAACSFPAISSPLEINISCKPDYVLNRGQFDQNLSIENIYIKIEEFGKTGTDADVLERILESDTPFECATKKSFVVLNDSEITLICGGRTTLSTIKINKKTGSYKRSTTNLNSKDQIEDVSGKCYKHEDLF